MKTLTDYKNEAIALKRLTFETVICWEVSCFSINDARFNEGVIELCKTENKAKRIVKKMKVNANAKLHYKPFVVDNDSYVKVTSENMKYYDKNGEFVKQLKSVLSFQKKEFKIPYFY
jgi:hypothetical protein